MRRYLVLSLLIVLSFTGCGDEGVGFPFVAAGEIPEGIERLPDENYLLVGNINPALFFKSDFGEYVSSRFPLLPLVAVNSGINMKEDISDISFGMKFDSRAYPHLYKTYQFVISIDFAPKTIFIDTLMSSLKPEKKDLNGSLLYSFIPKGSVFGENNPFFLYLNDERGMIISNNRTLMDKAILTSQGKAPGLSAERTIFPLIEKMDKSGLGWLVARHTKGSRNLLQQFIEPFNECYINLVVDKEINMLCVLNFEEKDMARRAVKGFEIVVKSMDQMEAVFDGMQGDESTAMGLGIVFMRKMEATQNGKMAIYSATYEKEIFFEPEPEKKPETETEDEGKTDENN